MLEINLSVNAPELAEAMNNLAAALKGAKIEPIANAAVPVSAPAVAPAPVIAPAQVPVTPAPVPVAPAPTYNRDQIMTAGAALIDAGKINELTGLLNAFGVQAVSQLKQDQLGAFATELRKLGAQI